jgi:hypothetical protein
MPSAVARVTAEQEEFKNFMDEMRRQGLATPEEFKQ